MISSTPKRSAVRNGERTAFEARLDLGPQRDRVLGRLELAPVGGLDPALDRQRAPVARRPRVAQVQPRRVAVRRARDAVDLAHEHRHPRHRRLVDGEQRARAAADRARALGLGADHEAGLVDEVDDRQAELVAEVDEAHELVRRVAGQAAAVVLGVARRARRPGRPSSRASAVISERPWRAPSSNTRARGRRPPRGSRASS